MTRRTEILDMANRRQARAAFIADIRARKARRMVRDFWVYVGICVLLAGDVVPMLARGDTYATLFGFLTTAYVTMLAQDTFEGRRRAEAQLAEGDAIEAAYVEEERRLAFQARLLVERDDRGDAVAAMGVTPAGRPFAIEHEGDDVALVETLTVMGFDGATILDAVSRAPSMGRIATRKELGIDPPNGPGEPTPV